MLAGRVMFALRSLTVRVRPNIINRPLDRELKNLLPTSKKLAVEWGLEHVLLTP